MEAASPRAVVELRAAIETFFEGPAPTQALKREVAHVLVVAGGPVDARRIQYALDRYAEERACQDPRSPWEVFHDDDMFWVDENARALDLNVDNLRSAYRCIKRMLGGKRGIA